MAVGISGKVRQFLEKVLFRQEDLVQAVTYRRFAGVVADEETFTDIPLDVVPTGDLTVKVPALKSQTPFRAKGYVIQASSLPPDYVAEDAVRDLMVIDGRTYKVAEVEKVLDVAYFVKADK
jgi:hypothetical protein